LWQRHFDYLFRAWSDPRAIKVDGRPMFLVYRPHLIQQLGELFDVWRDEARRRGLPGLYFVAMKQFEFPVPDVLRHFDATMQFQPFEALFSPDFEGRPFDTASWSRRCGACPSVRRICCVHCAIRGFRGSRYTTTTWCGSKR
jgi:hypothetical protein